ncbi:MAG: ribosomal RNA small subunit methyltransferase I [Candidatus Tectimicrobiota bacterium]|nr:MAG: ribosomal RNA small subunit methyltransferase I [Candidatus Tectomicrobia bacterium]
MAAGTLYVVATPIGNLEDITLRALRVLRSVDLIAAEDTRHTRKLLAHHGISRPLVSYHDHNKERQAPRLLAQLQAGRSVALVTDAGTPGISDPGYYLVRLLIAHGIPLVPVPGPTAVIAALSVAGLPTDRFVFEGFLPPRGSKRRQRLEALRAEPRTIVLYESPHRLLPLLQDLVTYLGGERQVVMARELTKRFEEVVRGTASELLAAVRERPVRGEITLVVAGRPRVRPAAQGPGPGAAAAGCGTAPRGARGPPRRGRR